MNTKERILDVSLSMFSTSGYEAVSIRDICGAVGIKESSLYYHFKNKRDILDSLLHRFEDHVNDLLVIFRSASATVGTTLAFDWMDTYFFDQYLFDPFTNKLMRLMMIEQFRDERARDMATRHFLTGLIEMFAQLFSGMMDKGLLRKDDPAMLAFAYTAPISALIHLCDREPKKTDEAMRQVEAFSRHFIKEYGA